MGHADVFACFFVVDGFVFFGRGLRVGCGRRGCFRCFFAGRALGFIYDGGIGVFGSALFGGVGLVALGRAGLRWVAGVDLVGGEGGLAVFTAGVVFGGGRGYGGRSDFHGGGVAAARSGAGLVAALVGALGGDLFEVDDAGVFVSCIAGFFAYACAFGFVLHVDIIAEDGIYVDTLVDGIIQLAKITKVYAFGESADFDGIAAFLGA